MNRMNSFKRGMKDGIPICLGYLAVSFTFGMMAVSAGLTIAEAVLISLTNLTSAGQFAGLTLIVGGAPYIEMVVTQLIINLRYSLMSFSLSQKLDQKSRPFHRFFVAFGITDEIFGISVSQPGHVSPFYNYGAMAVAIPGWTFGTLAGAVSGNLLPDFVVSALSVAIYGMFLAIIIPPAKKDRNIFFAVLAAMLISGVFQVTPVLKKISDGMIIIITTLFVSSLAAIIHPIGEEDAQNES